MDESGEKLGFVDQVRAYAKLNAGKVFNNEKEVAQGEGMSKFLSRSLAALLSNSEADSSRTWFQLLCEERMLDRHTRLGLCSRLTFLV